jgi:hypothetical protein
MKEQIFVMPASRLAGYSGDIHVNLDSSTPCWNDAIEALLKLTDTSSPRIFKGGHEKPPPED